MLASHLKNNRADALTMADQTCEVAAQQAMEAELLSEATVRQYLEDLPTNRWGSVGKSHLLVGGQNGWLMLEH